ncbi:MAG: DUF4328 domain-containing protein [Ferruginibacter sp.]|nr:DUF4328 domain-containing protein [Ferruginibacter sp.]
MILLPDNSQRSKNSLVAFYVMLAIQVAFMFSTFLQYLLLKRIQRGDYSQAEAEANDLRHQIIAYSNVAIYIVCIVLFIRWFRRAYNNLNLSGREYTKYGEGWASGAWFVPFLNLGRPYYIMLEIWEKTQSATENLITTKSGKIVGWWWALWIINNIGINVTNRLFKSGEIEDLITTTIASFIFNVIEMAALILLIIIIKNVAVFEQNLQHSLLNEVEPEGEDKLNFIVNEN